jgi:hypothetical protein
MDHSNRRIKQCELSTLKKELCNAEERKKRKKIYMRDHTGKHNVLGLRRDTKLLSVVQVPAGTTALVLVLSNKYPTRRHYLLLLCLDVCVSWTVPVNIMFWDCAAIHNYATLSPVHYE